MPPDDAPSQSLHAMQRRFARHLRNPRDAATTGPVPVDAPSVAAAVDDAGLAVYRNDARQFFRSALALTYPVTLRRVGEDFFRQLADRYRAAHPSRSGDLHRVGERFADWLQHDLAGGEYAWLADLARLEWACEEAGVAAQRPSVTLDALAVPPERLDRTALQFQPSLRLLVSEHPVWSVWQANQGTTAVVPVDLARGAEHCVCVCDGERVVVYRLDAAGHGVLAALNHGASFAEALAATGAGPEVLARVLDWAFGEGLVTSVDVDGPT